MNKIIRDVKGVEIKLREDSDVEYVGERKKYAHWIVWLIVLLLFIPAVIILIFVYEKFVIIKVDGVQYEVTESAWKGIS